MNSLPVLDVQCNLKHHQNINEKTCGSISLFGLLAMGCHATLPQKMVTKKAIK